MRSWSINIKSQKQPITITYRKVDKEKTVHTEVKKRVKILTVS